MSSSLAPNEPGSLGICKFIFEQYIQFFVLSYLNIIIKIFRVGRGIATCFISCFLSNSISAHFSQISLLFQRPCLKYIHMYVCEVCMYV